MAINIIPTETRYTRRKRGGGFWRFLAQLVFFLASLIPMCIIAWRVDLLGLAEPPAAAPAPEPVEPPPAPRRAESAPHVEREPIRRVQIRPAVDVIERTPLRIAPIVPDPADTVSVTLSMRSRRHRVALPVDSIEGLRVIAVGYERLDVAVPGTISLDGPRPVELHVAIESRASAHYLAVEPTVRTDAGRTIAFTVPAIERIGTRLAKQRREAADFAAGLVAERSEIDTWLRSPQLKALSARNAARGRMVALEKEIPAAAAAVAALDVEIDAAADLLDYAHKLDGAPIELAR